MKADVRRHRSKLPAISDSDLAYMAQVALTWNRSLPPGAVRARVVAGHLILSGEVRWRDQRHDAASCVGDLPGIGSISNFITLRAPPVEYAFP